MMISSYHRCLTFSPRSNNEAMDNVQVQLLEGKQVVKDVLNSFGHIKKLLFKKQSYHINLFDKLICEEDESGNKIITLLIDGKIVLRETIYAKVLYEVSWNEEMGVYCIEQKGR